MREYWECIALGKFQTSQPLKYLVELLHPSFAWCNHTLLWSQWALRMRISWSGCYCSSIAFNNSLTFVYCLTEPRIPTEILILINMTLNSNSNRISHLISEKTQLQSCVDKIYTCLKFETNLIYNMFYPCKAYFKIMNLVT